MEFDVDGCLSLVAKAEGNCLTWQDFFPNRGVKVKVISCNVNGIRSATRKDFIPWLKRQKADVVCLQEIRAKEEQFPPEALELSGYHSFLHPAEKPGYSGVAMYSREKPQRVIREMGLVDMDQEGRYIQLDFKKYSVISAYFPSGTSGTHRQDKKYEFLDRFEELLRSFKAKKREYIICGDWNIAHKKIDIKNWKSNQKNSGFLPEERAWLDMVVDELNYVDTFRQVDQRAEQYSWWSNRGRARENNVGWRIDYQFASPKLADKVTKASIYTRKKFSDHAPLIHEYDL